MYKQVSRWTILRASGAVETFWGKGSTGSPAYDYVGILNWIGREMQSAGSTYDYPNLLFADGKQVDLPDKLHNLGYNYVTERQKAYEKMESDIKEKWTLEQFK